MYNGCNPRRSCPDPWPKGGADSSPMWTIGLTGRIIMVTQESKNADGSSVKLITDNGFKHQELSALAECLNALNRSVHTLPSCKKQFEEFTQARTDIAKRISQLTVGKQVTEMRKDNVIKGAYAYLVQVSDLDGSNRNCHVMVGNPNILNGRVYSCITEDKQAKISEGQSVSIDVISITLSEYKKLTPNQRSLMNIRIEASGNLIPQAKQDK